MRTVYADMRCAGCGAVQRFHASAVVIVDGKELDMGLDQVAERAKAEFRERHAGCEAPKKLPRRRRG